MKKCLNSGWLSFAVGLAVLMPDCAVAEDLQLLSPIEVRAQSENLLGAAASGSEGVVSSQRIAAVPILRPGEVLEMVPGMMVTQHAGDGKANQYFLRGSTSTTGPISLPLSAACRSICPRTPMARAIPISTS